MRRSVHRVALLVETSRSVGRGILTGINRYVREHDYWSLSLEPRDLHSLVPPWLEGWKGDGIIARIANPHIAEMLSHIQIPIVNVSSAFADLEFPRVESNPESQARMAARHFIERGFRNFAFCGEKKQFQNWSTRVSDHFWTILEELGYQTGERNEIFLGDDRNGDTEQDFLNSWVSNLPQPTAILAINDLTGLRLLEACYSMQVQVPDQVAVLGLENDELVCTMADPPLSSLIPNSQAIGYKAAEILDQLMRARTISEATFQVEPIGIVTRQSTDIRAHHDEVVSASVRYIRENALKGIDAADVARHLNVSRSCLDRRFRAALDRTPHQEITRVKLKAAMQLLGETKLSIAEIAVRVGYQHHEYMGVVFRRELRMTPGEFRQQLLENANHELLNF